MNKIKKLIAFLAVIIGAFFGALGGAAKKQFRRFGIPGIIFITGLLNNNYLSFLIWFWAPILCMGYGVPDEHDKGSDLGRFWYKIFKSNRLLTNIFTKATLGFMFSLVLMIISFIGKNWHVLKISIPLVMLSHIIFGGLWQTPGNIKIGEKQLSVNELLRYGFLTAGGIAQII